MPTKQTIFVGDVFKILDGCTVRVVTYKTSKEITVEFSDGVRQVTQAGLLKSGRIKDPNARCYFGVGFAGRGQHRQCNLGAKGGTTRAYSVWTNMLRRCYDPSVQNKQPTYKGCSVADEWHNFQNFAEWFYSQPHCDDPAYQLDKDFIEFGNKIYGPEKCFLFHGDLNKLLGGTGKEKRGEYPKGVTWHKRVEKFIARCSFYGKRVHLGVFDTTSEAFAKYKSSKEKYVKDIAQQCKHNLPEKVYNNLMNFTVSVDD